MSMKTIEWTAKELTHKDFFDEINYPDHPVFVDFWAAWCPPCRMMDPVIEELAEEYKEKIIVRKLNTDLYRAIAGKLNISGVPTYVIFKEGKELWRNIGAVSKVKLKRVMEELLDE